MSKFWLIEVMEEKGKGKGKGKKGKGKGKGKGKERKRKGKRKERELIFLLPETYSHEPSLAHLNSFTASSPSLPCSSISSSPLPHQRSKAYFNQNDRTYRLLSERVSFFFLPPFLPSSLTPPPRSMLSSLLVEMEPFFELVLCLKKKFLLYWLFIWGH